MLYPIDSLCDFIVSMNAIACCIAYHLIVPVFVAAASAHRKDAFRACEDMIDKLKIDTPFWKKEVTD